MAIFLKTKTGASKGKIVAPKSKSAASKAKVGSRSVKSAPTTAKTSASRPKTTSAKSTKHHYLPPKKAVTNIVVTKKTVIKTNKVKKKIPIKWPPSGFSNLSSDATAPTAFGKYASLTEIKNESTNSPQVKNVLVNKCTKFACRGIYVTAKNSCSWWLINSDVFGVDPSNTTQLAKLGKLVTYAHASDAKQVLFTLLVSSVPAAPGTTITNVTAECMSGTPLAKVPSNHYQASAPASDTSTATLAQP
jgi:hypothetical protein